MVTNTGRTRTPSFYGSWKERKPLLNTLRQREAILQGAPSLVTRLNAVRYMATSTGIFRKRLKTTLIAMMDLIADRMIMPLVASGVKLFNRLGQRRLPYADTSDTVHRVLRRS